jgi:hypothetical protein
MHNKIYISGKITGLPLFEAATKFAQAEHTLRRRGFNPVNPLTLDHSHNPHADYNTYMKTDIKAMLDCDSIYMLPCWQDSKGAKIELQLAIQLNYSIIWGERL